MAVDVGTFVIDLTSADADKGLLLVNVFNGCSSQDLSSSSHELVSKYSSVRYAPYYKVRVYEKGNIPSNKYLPTEDTTGRLDIAAAEVFVRV